MREQLQIPMGEKKPHLFLEDDQTYCMTRTFLIKHINTNFSTVGAISNSFRLFAPILGRMSVVTVHLKPP